MLIVELPNFEINDLPIDLEDFEKYYYFISVVEDKKNWILSEKEKIISLKISPEESTTIKINQNNSFYQLCNLKLNYLTDKYNSDKIVLLKNFRLTLIQEILSDEKIIKKFKKHGEIIDVEGGIKISENLIKLLCFSKNLSKLKITDEMLKKQFTK